MPKVVVKEVGKEPEIREVEDLGLETFQGLVEGYIENVFVDQSLALVVNEEGHVRSLPFNIRHPGDRSYPIAGNVVLTAYRPDGDNRSLTDEECELGVLMLSELALEAA